MVSVGIYSGDRVTRERLLFAAKCIAEVFPERDEDRVPKSVLFVRAAKLGMTILGRPGYFDSAQMLRIYMRNHWPTIRYMLPKEHGFVPVYIDGAVFGGGGGYRKGDKRHVEKQLVRDKKIADGVVNAANDYSESVLEVFPQIEATNVSLVSRRIGRR